MRSFLFFVISVNFVFCSAQMPEQSAILTPFEISGKRRTATYNESIVFYDSLRKMANKNNFHVGFDTIGFSDNGREILVFKVSSKLLTGTKTKILINNNIHPGEPEGVDASMLLCREILLGKSAHLLSHADLYIVLMYNVDGGMNRSCCSRANQNGPEEVGFRGNARNLDLNRDFIKADSRNAQSFIAYFLRIGFDLMIDNHTSNGADYSYTLTYFHTRPEKISAHLRNPLDSFNKGINKRLLGMGWPTAPYVEILHKEGQPYVPENGIYAFWESGRYATGFAALHHCLGFTVETHMLKPFPQRVEATKAFLMAFLEENKKNASAILKAKKRAMLEKPPKYYTLQWKLDDVSADSILFAGYAYGTKPSKITGSQRLYFDTSRPFIKKIPYFTKWIQVDSSEVPHFYLIPQAWREVVDRLAWNGVKMKRLSKDTIMQVKVRYITQYETVKKPYEGHYLHYQIKTRDTLMWVQYFRGDYLVDMLNNNWRFVFSVLEPRSPDSYFAWNFFDGILMQKEGYSDYVFEDLAVDILDKYPEIKSLFEKEMLNNAKLQSDASAQLDFIYKNSPYYEPSAMRVPIGIIPFQ